MMMFNGTKFHILTILLYNSSTDSSKSIVSKEHHTLHSLSLPSALYSTAWFCKKRLLILLLFFKFLLSFNSLIKIYYFHLMISHFKLILPLCFPYYWRSSLFLNDLNCYKNYFLFFFKNSPLLVYLSLPK